jgi:hypothetical protein
LKKSPTGPAFTKDPLKTKSAITSNNKVFIADNSMNRLVCLGWISKLERKFFLRDAGGTTQNPAQTPATPDGSESFSKPCASPSVSALRAGCERLTRRRSTAA